MTTVPGAPTRSPLPAYPRPRDDVETAFLAPEAVLLDAANGRVHHLNQGSSAVWMLLDGELSTGGVAAELAELFELPIERLAPEVEAAVADFAERGLLVGTEQAAEPTIEETAVGGHSTAAASSRVLERPPDP